MRKEKMLVSLVVITLITLVFGSVASLATSPIITSGNTANPVVSGNTATENKAENTAANTADNSASNNATSISAAVGATNTNSNAANTNAANTNSNTNSNTNKASNYANNSANKLPYAGSNTSVVFVVIALTISAAYAYKKVSDYNV